MKKHLIFICLISGLTSLAWHKILFQSFLGEGYNYFLHGFRQEGYILKFDVGAGLLFDFLKGIFYDNLMLYQGLALLSLVILAIFFYFFIFSLCNNRIISFFGVILFSVNYGSTFEMVAIGSYQNFVQRVLFFIFLFPSFSFFVWFVKSKKEVFFILSLLLYTLGVFLAHFNIFFLPIYWTYLLGLLLSKKLSFKKGIVLTIRTLLFAVVSFLILYGGIFFGAPSFLKGQNFIDYVLGNNSVISIHLMRQLTILTVPNSFLKGLLINYDISLINRIDYFYLPILIIYALTAIYLWKKDKDLRYAIVTAIFFLPIVFILNLFMRSENVMYLEYGSRYLYVPSIGFAIFWAIFLYSLFKKNVLKPLVVVFLIWWIATQTNTIWTQIDTDFYKHTAMKKSLAYIKNISSQFKEDSLIVSPSIVGPYGSDFANLFYGKKHTVIMTMSSGWNLWEWAFKKLGRDFNPTTDYILNYDFKNEKVVDITKDYKEIIRDKERGLY